MTNKKFTKKDLEYFESYGMVLTLNGTPDVQTLFDLAEYLGEPGEFNHEFIVYCSGRLLEDVKNILDKMEGVQGSFTPSRESARMKLIDKSFNIGGRDFHFVEVPEATVSVALNSNLLLPVEDKERVRQNAVIIKYEV